MEKKSIESMNTKAELTEEQLETVSGSADGRYVKYTVRPGDTLGKIAKSYGISVAMLMEMNPGVKSVDSIRTGTVLFVPNR